MKRFYKEVVVAGDFSILLDGKPINTPKKAKLAAPTRALAEAIAHEWREQSGDIRPANMSLTKLANTAIDHAQELRSNIEAELLGFGRHDLLCYRAVGPHELILRQRMAWDPLLDWAHHTLGARLTTTHGIGHVEQGTDALAALDREVRSQDSWTLIGLQTATTITGSLILAFAIASGRLASAEAFALSRIDETFQLEKWGRDSDAEQRARCHAAELEMAAKFIELARA